MSKRILAGSALLAAIFVAGVAIAANSHESRKHARHSRGDHETDRVEQSKKLNSHERHAERKNHLNPDKQQGRATDANAPAAENGIFANGAHPQAEVR